MKIDQELCHPIHAHHWLKLQYTETPFYCDGCKEAGIGLKYTCERCEFDLHKTCALARPNAVHPFYNKCYFELQYRPPGPIMRICNACHNEVQGFVYHCKNCGFDLHPCCASLPKLLEDGEGEHTFSLSVRVSGPACHYCGGKVSGWAYRSQCKNYNLHVSCVKKLLVESWEAMYFNVDKSKVREMQSSSIPSLKSTMKTHHRGKGGKLKKCCQIAGAGMSIIVSALLGDPTVLIASVVAGFISKQ